MLHALLIGINNYQGNVPQLSGCLVDTDSIHGLLLQYPAVNPQNITVLNNENATKNGIVEALKAVQNKVKSDDTVLIYYSGHGAREIADKNLWHEPCISGFVCHDSLAANGSLLSDKELRFLLQPISLKSKRLVVFTDCCHSGSITRLELFPRLLPTPLPTRKYTDFIFSSVIKEGDLAKAASINDLLPQPTHLHIAACEDDKLAYESGGGGQLTQTILYYLKRSNGEATYAELLKEARAELTLRGQTPALTAYNEAMNWQNEFFLGESEFNDPNTVLLKFLQNKGWRILSGETNGLITQQNKSELKLTVFDGKSQLTNNLEIDKVGQTETTLAPKGFEGLEAAKTYRVFVSGGYPPLRVFLSATDDFTKKQLTMDYANSARVKQMEAFCVKIVTEKSESDYILVAEKLQKSGTALRILPTKNDKVPIAGDIYNSYDALWEDVKAIQRYRKALHFYNPNTKWTSPPVAIGYSILEEDGTETPILYTETGNFIEISDNTKLRITLRNLQAAPMYVAAVRLSSLFGLDNTLHPCDKLEQQNDTRRLQGGAITFTMAAWAKEFELTHEVTNHLFIISTQPIDTSIWMQKDFPPPQKQTDKPVMMRSQGRAVQVRKNEDDWMTVLVQIGVKKGNAD